MRLCLFRVVLEGIIFGFAAVTLRREFCQVRRWMRLCLFRVVVEGIVFGFAAVALRRGW
ncbi:hypothetical protein BC567DRAFT_239721 [Phyllosticta citribraziliensis]